ncbi:hypothetical protein MKX08_006796 [Trichoderma sp. CBMAI-0020]|nr:hypothetical protein MKX08_006796 [Trichoderma sp. CBMAI-0020]
MVPEITSWEELLWVYEEVEDEAGDLRYTEIAKLNDDKIFYGQISKSKANISLQEIFASITQIPDQEIFPGWPQAFTATKAPQELPPGIYIQRPKIAMYDVFSKHNVVHLLRNGLGNEIEVMEVLRNQPHPNIVGHHGCHVRRGYITRLVLDRHPHDLNSYLKSGQTVQNEEPSIESLQSAIDHLHTLGLAHNDLNPSNVLVAEDGSPILIDFDSARKIGENLSTSRGTKGWIDCEMENYTTSNTKHDMFALDKLRAWLRNPTFED